MKLFRILIPWIFAASGAAAERGAMSCESLPAAAARFEFRGVIQARSEASIEEWLLKAPAANPGMLGMFRVRDRQPRPTLVPWAGEFAGKYLVTLELALRMSGRPELREHAERFLAGLLATQADDGYLGPFPKDERLLGHWDLWGHYHVTLGLLLAHERSGDPAPLAAARKAADLMCRIHLDGSRRVADAGSSEMNMAVIHSLGMLFRLTGEVRYRELMQHIEKDWEGAGDYLRTGLAGVEFYQTPKPRWESLHCLQGLVESWRITGDERYRRAFEHHWRSILRTDVHNAGSFSSGEQASGNAFAPGAIETCCTVAWMALSVDMLRLTGDPRVADELERSTLNGALAAQHPSGRWWTYDTPMNGARKSSAQDIVFQARAGTPELNCCSVNGPRALGMLSEWAVMTAPDGALRVNWLGPLSVRIDTPAGAAITLHSETAYPADGNIRWKIAAPAGQRIDFRIPAWAAGAQLILNDSAPVAATPGTCFSVVSHGEDRLQMRLPMAIRAVHGEREQAGKVSLFRGPLLLAFDPRWNAFDEPLMPAIDLENLHRAKLDEVPNVALAPWLLVKVPGAAARPVRLCDYASAGATGTRVRSWLPAARSVQKPPPAPLVAATLKGDVRPQTGAFISAQGHIALPDAVRLEGKGARLVYALPENFGTQDFTVAVRVRLRGPAPPRLAQIFSAWAGPSDDPLRLVLDHGRLHARIEAGQTYSTAGVPIEAGRWHDIAAVKSDDWLVLYLDGEPVASTLAPIQIKSAARDFALGGNPHFSGDESLAADFAGLVIWDCATEPPTPARD